MRFSLRFMCLPAAILGVAVFMASCATEPPGTGTTGVSCTLLNWLDLGSYGANYTTNPFLAPTSMLKGTPDEFVALDLMLSLPDSATVNLDGAVRSDSGDLVARMNDLPQMRDYWDNWGDRTDKTSRTRLDTLNRWCMPSSQFVAHKGRTEYVIVLMGKNPLPRPASVVVSVSLNAGDPQTFTFPLPPKKK
jgi:hypothetical protein